MIVHDDMVDTALEYLGMDPHPLAKARKLSVDAENRRKAVYAESFLMTEGTVKERESLAELNVSYQRACVAEADAIMELENQKAKVKQAEMLLEIWRSEQANVRAAEKIR